MRFCQLGPGDAIPDADTLWDFREALIGAGALDALFAELDRAIAAAGYLPRGGQIVDATLVAAPRQRLTEGEKARIKEGRAAAEIWPEKPAKARQKDVDARWTLQRSKARARADEKAQVEIAVPLFGYKSHVSIDRMHGIVRRHLVTDAARHDGARLREGLIRAGPTPPATSGPTAPTARPRTRPGSQTRGWSAASTVQPPRGRPMPQRTRRANAAKSALRSKVEPVFAHQKARMRLTIRTIGIARAQAAITLANMATT